VVPWITAGRKPLSKSPQGWRWASALGLRRPCWPGRGPAGPAVIWFRAAALYPDIGARIEHGDGRVLLRRDHAGDTGNRPPLVNGWLKRLPDLSKKRQRLSGFMVTSRCLRSEVRDRRARSTRVGRVSYTAMTHSVSAFR
jgi:hypothetical protein